MGSYSDYPRLDALNALLSSARELARMLEADPALGRVVEALSHIAPDEREALITAIERAVGWRRVNESVTQANGVRLVVNPNPRLFVRVIDAQEPELPASPDPEEVLIAITRLLHRAPIMACDAARAVWEPALEEALGMVSAENRRAALAVVRRILSSLDRAIADPNTSEDES